MYAFRLPFTSGGASRLPRGHVSAFAPFGHTHMRTLGYACNPAIFLLSQRNSHLYLYCLSFADNECKSELVYAVTPSSYITCKRVLQHASKDMCRKKGNFNNLIRVHTFPFQKMVYQPLILNIKLQVQPLKYSVQHICKKIIFFKKILDIYIYFSFIHLTTNLGLYIIKP